MLLRNLLRVSSQQSTKINCYNNLFYNNLVAVRFSSDNSELRALANMLGMKQQKINDEIKHTGDVRLVNQQSKLIGIFPFEKALENVQSKGMDLLLVTDQVSPIICKATNYKDMIYNKFVKEIVLQDSSFKKKKTKKTSTKKIKVSTSISMGDLKNKALQTAELAKKFEQITVYIYCNDKTVDSAKNILHTFSDIVRNDMQIEGESEEDAINSVQIDQNYLEEAELENEDDNITQKVEIKFSSTSYTQTSSSHTYSEEEIKALIKQYFGKNQRRGGYDQDTQSEIQKDQDRESQEKGYLEEEGEQDFHNIVLQEQKANLEKDYGDDLIRSMGEFAREANMDYDELKQSVNELKHKYNASKAEEALNQEILAEQQFRLKTVERIMRLVNQK